MLDRMTTTNNLNVISQKQIEKNILKILQMNSLIISYDPILFFNSKKLRQWI